MQQLQVIFSTIDYGILKIQVSINTSKSSNKIFLKLILFLLKITHDIGILDGHVQMRQRRTIRHVLRNFYIVFTAIKSRRLVVDILDCHRRLGRRDCQIIITRHTVDQFTCPHLQGKHPRRIL